MKQKLIPIGRNILIDIIGQVDGVLAKVDTGADSSAIWASHIDMNKDGSLSFTLFNKSSALYTGKVITSDTFTAVRVRSSNGHEQIRYRVEVPIRISGRLIRATFTLADRSRNTFPVLIGRRTLINRFIVDVSKYEYDPPEKEILLSLTDELNKNPQKFHRKYHRKSINPLKKSIL